MSTAKLEFCTSGKDHRMTYGRKVEEYVADFCLVSRRALSPLEYDIFRFHFLLGANWKLCCWRLNLDRGTFFHMVYKIEQTLGRVYRELEPYGLFPLDEYFANTMHDGRRSVPIMPTPARARVLHPPLVRTAA